MKIKHLFLIPSMILAVLVLSGCNGGANPTSEVNTVNVANKSILSSNNGLLVTNASSLDINWGNDSLENIPVGSKGIKAIKVTNITNQPFNKLTLETLINLPQSITIDNDRTTCSMSISLAANSSCLYVFDYVPVGSYESGTFVAKVSADQDNSDVTSSIDVDYSTRVSANAGTLAVNVDTSALNCSTTSCNGTLYVVNSKGDKVSTVVNIDGKNGTIFGAGLVNLDSNDSYTIQASPINGSIPAYSPNQTIKLVADKTTIVTVKYPSTPISSGKAIITLPKVLPAYTGNLKLQILNTKNVNQVVDTEELQQGDTIVVDLPISDDSHSYVVKLANGIADPVNGLFYDQQSPLKLAVNESSITNLSISMEKATSLALITLNITGLQYVNSKDLTTDTATVSFSDADNYYKYVNQYGVVSGSKAYHVKNGLNFSIQVKANGLNNYKINPIVNNFVVNGTKYMYITFEDYFVVESLVYIGRFNSQNASGKAAFTNDGKYMYSTTALGTTINRYNVGNNGSINYSGAFNFRSSDNPNNTIYGVAVSQSDTLFIQGSRSIYKYNIFSDGSLNYLNNFTTSDQPYRTTLVVSPNYPIVYLAGTYEIGTYNLNFDLQNSADYDMGGYANAAVVNPRGNILYTTADVPSAGQNFGYQISRYSLKGNTVNYAYNPTRVDFTVRPNQALVSTDNQSLYISDGSTVEVFHLNNFADGVPTYVRRYNLSGNIALSPDGKYLYTVDSSWVNQYAINH